MSLSTPSSRTNAFLNPKFTKKFIAKYKSFPCLWKMKSDDYFNKARKAEAYTQLVELTKTEIPEADIDFVKRRIDALRGSFRKEHTKVRKSMVRGWGEVHKPKLWYYDLLTFLADRANTNGIEEDGSRASLNSENGSEGDENEEGKVDKTKRSKTIRSTPPPEPATASPSRPRKRKLIQMRPQFRRVKHPSTVEPASSSSSSSAQQDEYDALGKIVAAKLRKMTETQRIYADKLINDVLYQGLLNQLSPSVTIADSFNNATPSPGWIHTLRDEDYDAPSPSGTVVSCTDPLKKEIE